MIWHQFVVSIVCTILSGLVFLKCFSLAFEKTFILNKKNILYIIVFCMITFINNYYNIANFKFFISFIITLLFFTIIFKEDVKKTIVFTFILFIVATIIEIILVLLVSQIKPLKYFNQFGVWIKLVLSLLHVFIIFALYNIKKYNKLLIIVVNYISHRINQNFIFVIIIIVINILFVLFESEITNTTFILFLTILSLFIVLFILNINEGNKKREYLIKTKYLSDIVEKYENIIKDYKILKHNLINDLLSIKTNFDSKSIDEKIKKYSKDYEWLSTIGEIPQGIQGMIYLKSEQARKKKITFVIESNNIKTKELIIKPKMITKINEILGIYLDNAIEAVNNVAEKKVYISLIKFNSALYIKIINEINSTIDLEMLGKESYSTKKKKSGLGLYYAKKLCKTNVRTNISINNNFYCVNLKISLKN